MGIKCNIVYQKEIGLPTLIF